MSSRPKIQARYNPTLTVPPTAVWTDVSCDGHTLRGNSSTTGPFELPLERVLAIGQHVRYPDDTNPILPDIENWVSILTAQEFGLIHESSWSLELTEKLARTLHDDRLHLLLWPEWSGWDRDRGSDSRFVYPPWAFGLPVYEWSKEKDPTGELGATAARLCESGPTEQRQRWESWLQPPTPATTLGSVRCSRHWEFPFGVWWLPYALTFAAAIPCAVYWERLASSPGGWAALAVGALGLGFLWQPQWSAQTTLYDHGITLRTRIFCRRRCFYAEIRAMEKTDTGLTLRTATETLRIPASHRIHPTEIEYLTGRSQALLFARPTTAES